MIPKVNLRMTASSRTFLKSAPSPAELQKTIDGLWGRDDVSVILFVAACLDAALESLLKAKFVQLSKDEYKLLFDGSAGGLLGSLSAKIRISFAMGLLTPDQEYDLNIIAGLRNVFAHSLPSITTTTTEVSQGADRLKQAKLVRIKNANILLNQDNPRFKIIITFQCLYGVLRFLSGDRRFVTGGVTVEVPPSP